MNIINVNTLLKYTNTYIITQSVNMQKLKAEEHNLLTSSIIKILTQNRITTILEFLQEDTEKLTTLTRLSLPQIISVRDDIFKKYSAPVVHGPSLLVESSIKKRFLSTGIQKLDAATGGGIPIGYITEVCGLSDSGKTQLCLQLALNCVKNSESTVLYVDTKDDFSAIRIQKILDSCGYSHKEMALIMFKIRIVHVWTMEEMIELLRKLKDKTVMFENLVLIVIDSLPCLMFQFLGDENKVGLSLLNMLVNYSRCLCNKLNASVICVNIQTRWIDQDVTDVEDDGDSSAKDMYIEKRNRCLGKYWQHIPALILLMEKTQEKNANAIDTCSRVNVTVNKYSDMKYEQKCMLKIDDLGIT